MEDPADLGAGQHSEQAQLGVGCVYHRAFDGGNEFVVGSAREE
jgi:hypothetical protein